MPEKKADLNSNRSLSKESPLEVRGRPVPTPGVHGAGMTIGAGAGLVPPPPGVKGPGLGPDAEGPGDSDELELALERTAEAATWLSSISCTWLVRRTTLSSRS